jgi:hypothetical protein
MRLRRQPRPAATLVECAIIYPVTFLILIGLLVGAMGMFRYQEMASLSREAARYASVHGTEYARDTGTTAPTPEQIYQEVVVKRAVGLDLERLSYSITYDRSNSPTSVKVENGDVYPYVNRVKVTLTYQWIPEAFLGGITLTSTAEIPMSH